MSVNKVILIGRLGKDVEIDKQNAGATQIAKGSLAVSESYQDKNKEWKEVVDWVQLRFYDRLSKSASERLKKGMEIYVEGKIKTWKFERGGKTEYGTAVKVEKFLLFKGSNPGGNPAPVHENEYADVDDRPVF